MAWTPYVGDPYAQVGEAATSAIGPNYHPSTRSSRGPGMTSAQRLTRSIAGAAPWQQLSPDQQFFIDNAGTGRWANDAPWTGATPAMRVVRHPDGTCDVSPLSAFAEFHVDLGGHGARDVAATRPF